MTLQIRATNHQLADLKRIVVVGPDKLAQVRAKLGLIQTPTLRPQELLASVGEVISAEEAQSLVRQLLSLHGVVRQSGHSVAKVVAGVRSAVQQQGADAGIDVDAWSTVEGELSQLLEERSVRLATTAIELAYDYANLLRRTKILTDIRPLYDEAGDHIEGAVVSYTLRLRYDSADGEHELSIALDDEDIKRLAVQCNRAIHKARAAAALMQKTGVAVAVFGEVTDAGT